MNASNPKDETTVCPRCKGEPERGYIEMSNNGPIVPCWVCNWAEWRAHGNGRYSSVSRSRGMIQEQYEAAWRVKESLR